MTKTGLTKTLLKELFTDMVRIRQAEEKVVAAYPEQMMRTPTHLSIGQEAVAVGVAHAIEKDDRVFAGHRCHAAYLSRGGSWDGFFAELCGRANGTCGGRAGSAHLSDGDVNVYSSPILSAMIPVACGAALSFQMDKKRNIAVAFLGDAAIEEGVFAESLNFAVLKKLPVLFVCENNLYSTHSPLKVRQPPSPIYKRVQIPELPTCRVDGNDVVAVYRTMKELAAQCRRGKGPAFVECLTYRIREHVGPLMDYDRGYRTKREVEAWMKKCPVRKLRAKIIRDKIMTAQEVDQLVQKYKSAADAAYAKALKSPWPEANSLLNHVY